MSSGKFITLEGGEGTGKTTQARILLKRLQDAGKTAVVTREPGGSAMAEAIRSFVLSGEAKDLGPFAESVLFAVAREDHLEQTIRPALARGDWVICDRFSDSTRAYQGAAGVKASVLKALERAVVEGTRPDLTIVLDMPAEDGLGRAHHRAIGNGTGMSRDHFELKEIGYHKALRQAYLEIAKEEPERVAVVDAARPEEEVADKVWDVVVERLHP